MTALHWFKIRTLLSQLLKCWTSNNIWYKCFFFTTIKNSITWWKLFTSNSIQFEIKQVCFLLYKEFSNFYAYWYLIIPPGSPHVIQCIHQWLLWVGWFSATWESIIAGSSFLLESIFYAYWVTSDVIQCIYWRLLWVGWSEDPSPEPVSAATTLRK